LRALEDAAAQGLPAGTLMARAGRNAATWIHARYGRQRLRIVIVCGPGNNGGDGYVCGSELAALGHQVRCVALAAPKSADAMQAAQRWEAQNGPPATALDVAPLDLVIDALFGIGLQRPLEGSALHATRWINEHGTRGVPVIALDVPSGLDADHGAWVGGVEGVLAAATLTFLAAKPGLFTGEGTDACGEVVLFDLETAPTERGDGALNAPECFAALRRRRPRNSHKGSFGNVAIVGGNTGMVGAALLAGRAALRLGAGRVYVDCIGAPDLRVDPLQPELMFRSGVDQALLGAMQAIVVGCGLGADGSARAAVTVFDADALNLIAAHPAVNRAARRMGAAPRVLTPHPLEAARLLSVTAAEVQRDRIGTARQLAQRHSAWVVLKGAGSVIAAPDTRYWINITGSPALATAGTGDVLAGMIGALLAQGYEAQAAVLGAVWLHGRAAEHHGGDVGLVAGDLPSLAASELNQLRTE
jgi:hydroxyethylthiazole kinase-like uncharacterized protein yjeF